MLGARRGLAGRFRRPEARGRRRHVLRSVSQKPGRPGRWPVSSSAMRPSRLRNRRDVKCREHPWPPSALFLLTVSLNFFTLSLNFTVLLPREGEGPPAYAPLSPSAVGLSPNARHSSRPG